MPEILQNVAGMSIQGGRRENFYFCLLEYYQEQKRWFLKSVLPVKEENPKDTDQAIQDWALRYGLGKLVVDFPLSLPFGVEDDENEMKRHELLVKCDEEISELLKQDQSLYESDPKQYERERNEQDLFENRKDWYYKASDKPTLSKGFKRRLKKGLLTYWNRPIDLWVWREYYDTMMAIFKNSYDSFGGVSLKLWFRMRYLSRFFRPSLELIEGNAQICLIELLREKIIDDSMIQDLYDIELAIEARHNIIRQVEKHLNIFIYAHDIETMTEDYKAFQSFLMCLIGQRVLLKKTKKIPTWLEDEYSFFKIPSFYQNEDDR